MLSDDPLMKANDDVTDALHRTINLMQGELERSVSASQMLGMRQVQRMLSSFYNFIAPVESSTATLRSTSAMHDTLTNVMDTSKQLITALEASDWLDRLLIITGLAFFVLVVLFILKQRIVDRGLRIAFWWTRFFFETGRVTSMSAISVSTAFASTFPTMVTLSSAYSSSATAAVESPEPTAGSSILEAVASGYNKEPSTFASQRTTDSADILREEL
jgi:protein transport protein SEC20